MIPFFKNPATYCIISSCFFGSWPVLARYANLGPGWLTFGVSGTTFVVSLFALRHESIPSPKSLGIACGVGLLNALGTLAYSTLIGSKSPDATPFIYITAAATPLIMVCLTFLLFNDIFTIINAVGLGLVVVGIYLLTMH